MHNDVYKRAKEEIERRRTDNIALADSRSALLAEESEEIRKIDAD